MPICRITAVLSTAALALAAYSSVTPDASVEGNGGRQQVVLAAAAESPQTADEEEDPTSGDGGAGGEGSPGDDTSDSASTDPSDDEQSEAGTRTSTGSGTSASSGSCGTGSTGTSSSGSSSSDAGSSSSSRDTPVVSSNARTAGDLLDLRNWYLTLPTGADGDPDSIDQPELLTYSSEFFQLTSERDGVVFRTPVDGTTTKNSKYPRSELREMNGEEHAAWSNTSGTHVLDTCQAITETPVAKPEVVAAQIHDGGDDVMQIRLEGQTLVAQYADGDEQIVIDPNYQLGTPYDLRIEAADSRIVVFYNGAQAAELPLSGSSWYFKAGAYVQSNPERGDSPGAAGEVVVYSLSVEHSDQSGGTTSSSPGPAGESETSTSGGEESETQEEQEQASSCN
jgi:hypothetical protein